MSTFEIDNPAFEYPRGPYPFAGRCHLRVYAQGVNAHGGRDVVLVATDLGAENPGASVTNAIEYIVTAAVRRYGLDPARLTVVEHYDDRWAATPGGARRPRTPAELAQLVGRDGGESFDLVTFAHVPRAAGAPAPAGVTSTVPDGAGVPVPAATYSADPLEGDAFAGPSWRRVTKRQAEQLAGQPLP